MTGIERIAHERAEQMNKHGFTTETDAVNNPERELRNAALYLLGGDVMFFPESWNIKRKKKFDSKSYRQRLTVAAALIAAEIDRIDFIEEPETK